MPAADHFDDDQMDIGVDESDGTGVEDHPMDLGGDERRMHVRAYNHWVSLLNGRDYPTIADLDPASIADFGPNSVLIDFGNGIEDPGIAYLGRKLRDECALEADITRINDVPSRSLLSRLTDHYLQIIANRAPIGFEAEFVGSRGLTTLYRGILMPYSSAGESIDFIYGVINWKELVDAEMQATLDAELAAVRAAPRSPSESVVWADGPSAGFDAAEPEVPTVPETLGDCLAQARESAAAALAADSRSRAALYRALGQAHEFALAADADPDGYAALLADTGIKSQPRAPMTPIVKLVFGADYDKTRIAEYATVLAAARREGIAADALAGTIEGTEGGIKAIVAAERAARRAATAAKPKPDLYARAAAELRALPVMAKLPIRGDGGEFVVLLARVGQDGTLDIVQRLDNEAFVHEAVKRAAA